MTKENLCKELRFRQVHLDFHTSPAIDGIGTAFDKKLWQERLKMAHIDSITCFSCCHHGWSYHPTKVGEIHPGLKFDLLRAQIDACHEIDVKVPIYLTAGVNNRVAELEPGWREINTEGQWSGWTKSPLQPGFKSLCFNSPYLDYLARLVEEAAALFPDADGMFFDIISQGQCCCPWCMRDMKKEGFDPEIEEDRRHFARQVLLKYHKKITEAAGSVNPDINVFHNCGGSLHPGNRDIFPYYTHMELESLPTGGWGYDHYPLLAAYTRTLKHDFLGMTGKFHRSWGEFGGFKHPNALRYEVSAMLANGSKCSIGDQLHPTGQLDEATCKLIGKAYKEVEEKEPWCRNVTSCATVAILSPRGFHKDQALPQNETSEIGVSRFLLEAHIPFDRLDRESDITGYKVLILPDDLRPDADLRERLAAFLAKGGKIIAAGCSILCEEKDELSLPLPVEQEGLTKETPNYIECASQFAPEDFTTPFVMYGASLKIRNKGGESLGKIYDPYFVRSYDHFCSHRHTPNKPEPSGFDAGILTDNILYFAHGVFGLYATQGQVILKEFMLNAVKAFMEKDLPILTDLSSLGRVTLMEQKEEKRYIAHVLYANIIQRGLQLPVSSNPMWQESWPLQVIEELAEVRNTHFIFRLPEKIRKVTLEPQGIEIPFTEENGTVKVQLEKFTCHQMIVLSC